jgi:transcriptional regulator with XRE-family HTH domain
MPTKPTKKQLIAGRLTLARKQAGLSQEQVARLLGLHRPSISEVEAARRSVTAEELARLAEIYGVSLSWLTCSEDEDTEEQKAKVQLAARELGKLKQDDFERVLRLLMAMRKQGNSG